MEIPRTPRPREPRDTSEPEYTCFAGRPIPVHHEHLAAGYAVLREDAALVDLSHRTVLRLSGGKAVEMLNAVLTNRVPEGDHLGVYSLLLNPKGRIQTDLRLLKGGGGVLIDVEPEGVAAAKELLGRYAPFYRVEIEDLSETEAAWDILGLYGSRAGDILDGPELAEHETAERTVGDAAVLVAGVSAPVPGYDLLGPSDALSAALEHLAARGAIPTCFGVYETARIEVGIPRFGPDITPENFPAEAGILERAVSFEKGCYPGQETVARMHYRGHPNRLLRRLKVADGSSPEPGAPIIQNDKQVGRITSVAPLPVNGETLALGYLSRNADAHHELRAADAVLRPLP